MLHPSPTQSTGQPPLTPSTVDGVVLEAPRERHTHSHWLALRTAQGRLVRVMVACSAPAANWIEPGDRICVSGKMVSKVWRDGPYQTLTAHESLEIMAGGLRMELEGRPQ
jgi:hypothetical protein